MGVRARGTLILLALCLAIGAYLWFVERRKPTGEEKEAADRRVLAIPPAQGRYFQLDYGDSVVVLTRSAGQWRAAIVDSSTGTPGASFPADEAAVEQLSGFFAALTADRLLPAAEIDSSASGLDHPWVWVTVEAEADSTAGKPSGSAATGGQHLLAFGYQNPTRTAYYARIDQRPDVALLSSSAIDAAFRRPLSDFRDRHLARFDSDQVLAVDLGSPERTLGLRRVDGRWWIERPHYLADEAQVRGLLARLRDLQAVELGHEPAPTPLISPAALEVAVRGAGDSALAELTIGPEIQAGGEALHFVRASALPMMGSIRPDDFAGLTLTVTDLRDRHLVDLGGAAIDSLVITAGERRFRAAAGDSAFAAVFQGLPEWSATSFASETALGAVALAPYGLAPPRIVLEAKLRNDGVREVYLGRAEPSGGVFAARPGEPGVLVVSQAVVDAVEETMAKAQATIGKKAPPPSGP
jgi:Domain of unknown function (DUF4340)